MLLPAILHSITALWLALYGVNIIVLLFLYLKHRREQVVAPQVAFADLPSVVVQVPVYNEMHVVERVIDSVAALDYPADKLQIQILDDSNDMTTALACNRAREHRRKGVDVVVLNREEREGFKAGALAWGLDQTEADFVAIFDADFRPSPDFLLETVPYFLTRPRLGMVQTRWVYLNSDYSPITRAQSIAFDGHFVVEQIGRSRSGLLFNFNGSGGVWRRRCIEDSGGWTADTLTEDLDLSYRAQINGWECLYLPNVEVPAELPPQIAAFKGQQSRWAQGSIQTLRKLAPLIMRSHELTLRQKIMALLHLSSYLGQALMVPLLLLSLPVLLLPNPFGIILNGLGLVCAGPPLVYALSQRHLHRDWLHRLRAFPVLALFGLGISWENARAVWRGLCHWGGTFVRTPKYMIEGTEGAWVESAYVNEGKGGLTGEAALALYALVTVIVAFYRGGMGMIPFLLLYAASFGAVATLQLTQSRVARRSQRLQSSPITKAVRGAGSER